MDKTSDGIILVCAFGLILYKFLPQIQTSRNNLLSFLKSQTFISSALLFVILSLLVYFLVRNVLHWKKRKNERKKAVESLKYDVKELLKKSGYPNLNEYIQSIKEKLEDVENYPELKQTKEKLELELLKSEKELILEHYENKVQVLNHKNNNLLEEIEVKERRLNDEEKWKKQAIERKLAISENNVFKKDKLTKDQIKVLLENGFKHANEFCIKEKKVISVLVKSMQKRSLTHTFLIWSMKNLLKSMPEIENITEHDTKDADLTFRYQGKLFAIEIETGTLLSKHKQLQEKVNYLNKKYPKRWMFIVSNKELVWKYKKYGLSTQRNRVEETLAKMLETLHPFY